MEFKHKLRLSIYSFNQTGLDRLDIAQTRLLSRRGSINRRYRAVRTSQYYKHYQKWKKFFRASKVLVIDGHELRETPWVSVRVKSNGLY